MKLLSIVRVTISILLLLLMVFGAFLFLRDAITSQEYNLSKELPIHNVQGIIVTDDAIFIGLGSYSRIQEYTLDGEFVSAKNTHTFMKDFTFTVDEYGIPKVLNKHVDRSNREYLYDTDLLDDDTRAAIKAVDDLLKELNNDQQASHPREYTTSAGVKYYVNDGLKSSIVKTENGTSTTIKVQSIYKSLTAGSVIPWLIGLISMFMFCLINIFLLPEILDKGNQNHRIYVVLKVIFSIR